MNAAQQRAEAKRFAERWKGRGYEKGECQSFWLSLIGDVLGVEHPDEFIRFEKKAELDHTSFIDAYIESTHVMIEQKSIGKNLNASIVQSDGSKLKPIQQAMRYSSTLAYSERPRWIVICNFECFHIYDMEHPHSDPVELKLCDLPEKYYMLEFLVRSEDVSLKQEMEVSMQAGEIVGLLYDAFLKEYKDPTSESSLKSLNALCVRLVFCLYAEDAGIFGRHAMFHDYIQSCGVNKARQGLIDLFRVLDTPVDKRDPYMEDDLAAFPYVNGGLFSDENIEIPRFNQEIYDLLLTKASASFDWSKISPTIFGAVFESTLNPETRRKGGMHYTSLENIHKVIDPLFLNDLKAELQSIKEIKQINTLRQRLKDFQDKIAGLKFLDPAAGSGNFLTETYLCLRKIENEVIADLIGLKKGQIMGQVMFGDDNINPIKVSITQFYGIEINDFAVSVAKTALWIAESQMMKQTEDIVHMNLDFLPLKSYVNIVEGNALRIDWESVVPKYELNYIMGNPPFVGARLMDKAQKEDINKTFFAWKNAGNLDYVCCWYKKAANMMEGTSIRAALVSTNSVAQGESVANLWKPLFESGVHIDFAHRTFRWDSEAAIKAHVHCVIIGFSTAVNHKPKFIYDGDNRREVSNINGYLLDAENIFVESRKKPLCDVPEIGIGNKPIDGGNYLFTEEEKNEFIKKEPGAAPLFKPWYGSFEFINRKPRYCLWLGECSPHILRQLPECMKRIEAVREYRLASKSAGTVKLADKPTRFHVENMPKGTCIIIPQVSSERRRYIPIGYMSDSVLCSDKVRLMPEGTLYHFGILESNVHMSWMRTICCRLKSDYSYTVNDVYNNFPWPTPTDAQKARIEQTAQGILDARAEYPECSLADLYDETTMPQELRTAHQQNDRAVMEAYGLPVKGTTESSCVAELMRRYQVLTAQERKSGK